MWLHCEPIDSAQLLNLIYFESNWCSFFVKDAMPITTVQDVRTVPVVSVLKIKSSAKLASGSARPKKKYVLEAFSVALVPLSLSGFAKVRLNTA